MQTKGPSKQQEEERDIGLENTVGNLMVAEYQVGSDTNTQVVEVGVGIYRVLPIQHIAISQDFPLAMM